MNKNTRIESTDSPISAMVKLAEGNPGAVTVLCEILQQGEKIDPDAALGGLAHIFSLDTYGIYGHRIWLLYKDVCNKDIIAVLAILRAVQLGILQESIVQSAIDNNQWLDCETILAAVQKELPNFGVVETKKGEA